MNIKINLIKYLIKKEKNEKKNINKEIIKLNKKKKKKKKKFKNLPNSIILPNIGLNGIGTTIVVTP